MQLNNLLIFFRSQQFKNTQNWLTEEICSTKYSTSDLPNNIMNYAQNPDLLKASITKKLLDIPVANPYIAKNFDILPFDEPQTEYPTKIHQSPLIELWHLRDSKF